MLVDKNDGKMHSRESIRREGVRPHCGPGNADPHVLDIRGNSPTACREAINVLLAISASKGQEKWVLLTADVQEAFLKGEFRDKDRVLFCWPPKNGPNLAGVQPGSLLPILKGVFGLNDAPRKWWEKISTSSFKSGFGSSECALDCSRCTSPQCIERCDVPSLR